MTATEVVHLDSASCSLMSEATLAATVAHLEREAEVGGWAMVEVGEVFDGLRTDLGRLLGMRADQVALLHNATDAVGAVIASLRVPTGARVGVLRSEYGSNRMKLEATRCEVVELAVDGDGRLDLDAFDAALAAGLDLVVLSHVQSQVPVVQPVREVVAQCGEVPVLVDVAQSAGHIDVSGLGAAAVVGTSRKWLRGPRGAAFLAVADEWVDRMVPSPELSAAEWADEGPPTPIAGAARFEPWEASVAARVGFAHAVAELHAAGPATVFARIAAMGQLARTRLEGVGGWRVVEPHDEPTGSVTLTHPTADMAGAHRRLLDEGILTSLIPTTRALDMAGSVLRASFHTFNTEADLDRLATALSST